MKGIDNVYLINLDKDKDRLKSVLKECKKVGKRPIRVPGIQGSKLTEKELKDNTSNYLFSVAGSKSAIGCAMSHIKAWETMIKNGDDSALFLEDDVVIDNNFKEKFSNIFKSVPKDYGIFYMGCSVGCNPLKKYAFEYSIVNLLLKGYVKTVKAISNNVYIPALPLTAHGYILSKRGAKHLLNRVKKDKIYGHIDVQIVKYIYDIPSYAATPELIKQGNVDINTSNNSGTVNYPVIINKLLDNKDEHGVPTNYKLNIHVLDIGGVGVNGYLITTVIIGMIAGFIQINPTILFTTFIGLNIIEYYKADYNINEFMKHFSVYYIALYSSYMISKLLKDTISNPY